MLKPQLTLAVAFCDTVKKPIAKSIMIFDFAMTFYHHTKRIILYVPNKFIFSNSILVIIFSSQNQDAYKHF